MPAGSLDYATYFDRHYLTRGLALYRSLERHSPPFVLRVLCLDDETYATLSKLRLGRVELVPLAELERADPALAAVKPTRKPVEYYWTCGPAFLRYLFDRQPEVELLTYLDADLFFFGDPTPVYEELGDGSILLIEHRYSPLMYALFGQRGIYNVGMLVFRRTTVGLACLGRWREQCLDWCYRREERDRWADQKYLEEWPSRYEGVAVLQHRGAGLAPWNLGNYRLCHEGGRLLIDGDPLVFYHFNRLRVIAPWLYDPGLWRYRGRMSPTVKRHLYVPYVRELRSAGRLIRAAGGKVDPVDNLAHGRSKPLSLARMLRHRSFLVVTDTFVV